MYLPQIKDLLEKKKLLHFKKRLKKRQLKVIMELFCCLCSFKQAQLRKKCLKMKLLKEEWL